MLQITRFYTSAVRAAGGVVVVVVVAALLCRYDSSLLYLWSFVPLHVRSMLRSTSLARNIFSRCPSTCTLMSLSRNSCAVSMPSLKNRSASASSDSLPLLRSRLTFLAHGDAAAQDAAAWSTAALVATALATAAMAAPPLARLTPAAADDAPSSLRAASAPSTIIALACVLGAHVRGAATPARLAIVLAAAVAPPAALLPPPMDNKMPLPPPPLAPPPVNTDTDDDRWVSYKMTAFVILSNTMCIANITH